MRSIVLGLLLSACSLLSAGSAHAASCWAVTGWTSTNYVGANAILASTSCTTIPLTTGWVQVLGTPSGQDVWLRLSLSDSRVSNWTFQPLLVFSSYDANNRPVVRTDLLPCIGCSNSMRLLPYPPVQGVPVIGSQVRLRHAYTGKCVYSINQNGAQVLNRDCTNAADMTYVLDDAGSGLFRLRNAQASQCLYAVNTSGASLYNWGCWSDPNMRFRLVASNGGYRLEHVNTSQCPYGSSMNGGVVRTWGCWDDPNMVYFVDIIQNPSTGGSGPITPLPPVE